MARSAKCALFAVRRSRTALPFLLRIRYRRAILSRARGKLPAGPYTVQWHTALTEWAGTWRCPARLELRDDDRSVGIDLAEPPHARIIHQYLQRHEHAVLAETHEAGVDQYAVPMKAASLRGLPPALVLTTEVDPLRDDAEAYAERLRHDGVPTTARRHSAVSHGFFTEVVVFAKADAAIDDRAGPSPGTRAPPTPGR
ncbi:alpha/beta hydrolase fold domain-containing protein [Streptomyces sp. CL12-4]|uniref:alpha/beta hydrolase fold domain-containing protein n=1 Tax=Streptomyces sp. CL12-4 TaxID=2810306 RepID=UPI001FDD7627|nr:alpha/beta hydrolase fold domain-containing protein [Streptomyces sp. CL12-4]MCG8968841.1 alpha/beta hydrolase fold domain-containing protein [Streptomyces sp. CL12-4]